LLETRSCGNSWLLSLEHFVFYYEVKRLSGSGSAFDFQIVEAFHIEWRSKLKNFSGRILGIVIEVHNQIAGSESAGGRALTINVNG